MIELPPIQFPALAIGPDVGVAAEAGAQVLRDFVDATDFSTSIGWDLKRGERDGMLVADSRGRFWRILRATDAGPFHPFWLRLLRRILKQEVRWVTQEIVEAEPMAFPDFKRLVCATITASPDPWRDDELIAGEGGAPMRDEQELLDELQASVMAANTVPEIIQALYAEGV
jgi:hypothetical protein